MSTDGLTPSRPRQRAPRALPVDAVLFDLDGTLADTAPDLGAALNRVRRDLGLEPVALDALRSSASHGARGLLRVGMGIVPEHPDYGALRDAFLRAVRGGALRRHEAVRGRGQRCSTPSRRARSSGES